MITPKQLFKLMKESGVYECEVVGKDGERILAKMAPPAPKPEWRVSSVQQGPVMMYKPGEEPEELDNSAAMPEYDGGSPYKGNSVYDDPDLYPDGIDPVAELRKQHGLHPDESD